MNYLISPEAGCGHACELAKAISKLIPLETFYFVKSGYGLDYIHPGKIGYNLPHNGEHLIIMTAYAYDEIVKRYGYEYFYRFERVTIIVPDGRIWERPDYYAERWHGYELFATPCKTQYMPEGTWEYIQPFDLSYFSLKKYNKLTACHSPFSEWKMEEKDSEFIINVFRELDLPYKLVMGQKWLDALKEKATCQIFVDQLIGKHLPADYRNGIGKSGNEAMLLKCLVLSIGEYESDDIPPPPIIWVTRETLKEKLSYFMSHPKELKEAMLRQYEWAKKYTNPQFHAKRIVYRTKCNL